MRNLKVSWKTWRIFSSVISAGIVGVLLFTSVKLNPTVAPATPIAVIDSTYVDTSFTENTVDSVYLDAIEHLKFYEGFRSRMYYDTDGSRTIGYGHHLLKGESYQNITEATATNILKADLESRLEVIEAKYNVTGDTLLALGLFSFNCGLGTLNNAINNGILTKPRRILSYCHYRTYDVQGGIIWHTSHKLLKRRKYELALITN